LEALVNSVGGWDTEGEQLKSVTDWEHSSASVKGSNLSGFAGLPAGINGTSSGIYKSGYWWADTGRPDYICYYLLSFYSNGIIRSKI